MALLWRVVTTWSGGKIGTGYSNHFFREGVSTAQLAADAVKAFFAGVYGSTGTSLPTGISLSFSASVDVLEDNTGVLLTSLPVTAPSTISGSDSGNYSAPSGLVVGWRTAAFLNGHRVQGRTFCVPLGGGSLQSDGTPTSTAVGLAQAAAAGLISAAPELLVWHRPSSIAAADGAPFTVVAANVKDTFAMLTSRR